MHKSLTIKSAPLLRSPTATTRNGSGNGIHPGRKANTPMSLTPGGRRRFLEVDAGQLHRRPAIGHVPFARTYGRATGRQAPYGAFPAWDRLIGAGQNPTARSRAANVAVRPMGEGMMSGGVTVNAHGGCRPAASGPPRGHRKETLAGVVPGRPFSPDTVGIVYPKTITYSKGKVEV